MADSTTSWERRYERVRQVLELLLDFFLATFGDDFEVRFFTVLVGVAVTRLGLKVNARVIAALHSIRFTIQNLLCYGTIRKGTKSKIF